MCKQVLKNIMESINKKIYDLSNEDKKLFLYQVADQVLDSYEENEDPLFQKDLEDFMDIMAGDLNLK